MQNNIFVNILNTSLFIYEYKRILTIDVHTKNKYV